MKPLDLIKYATSFQIRVRVPDENQALNDNLFAAKSKIYHRRLWSELQRGHVVQLNVCCTTGVIRCPLIEGFQVPMELMAHMEWVENDSND